MKPGVTQLLGTSDNEGERILVSKILEGLAQLSPALSDSLTEAKISDIVNRHAPRGPKKMLLLLDVAREPRLDPRSIPPYRPIQVGELDDVLAVVGHRFTKALAMPVGPVAQEKRNEILKEAVAILSGSSLV